MGDKSHEVINKPTPPQPGDKVLVEAVVVTGQGGLHTVRLPDRSIALVPTSAIRPMLT